MSSPVEVEKLRTTYALSLASGAGLYPLGWGTEMTDEEAIEKAIPLSRKGDCLVKRTPQLGGQVLKVF